MHMFLSTGVDINYRCELLSRATPDVLLLKTKEFLNLVGAQHAST